MEFFDNLTAFFLFFANERGIIPLIILGFILFNRVAFGHALYLLLFTLIFNPLLKSTFQIPLSPSLGKVGFAFPSGHMQMSVAFYGWLIYTLPYLSLRIFLLFLVAGIGWSLIYRGYHNGMDIVGAVGVALLTLAAYKSALSRFGFLKVKPPLTGIFLLLLATLMLLCLGYRTKIPAHVWMAYEALAGFTLSWNMLHPSLDNVTWKQRGKALCFCIFSLALVYVLFQNPFLKTLPLYFFQLQWFVMAALMPVSIKIAKGR